eukprot:TRINITY_DN946_c0_g1_i3.p1 TRINITY_DN946_c0_g1~~TRINITY_DN946_c0_g1_i3.p1  ORF type:complete len:224 (-),score=44.52 TRINITY_DN946_c0_g1_i3:37-708(-)
MNGVLLSSPRLQSLQSQFNQLHLPNPATTGLVSRVSSRIPMTGVIQRSKKLRVGGMMTFLLGNFFFARTPINNMFLSQRVFQSRIVRVAAPLRSYSSPADLRYTKSHEWIRVEGDKATVGITNHAQELLGDVVFVELPEVNATLEKGQTFGAVESVKAASDLYLPVSGQVIESNAELESSPELVNSSPYENGWLTKITISNPQELEGLLGAEEYDNYVKEEAH